MGLILSAETNEKDLRVEKRAPDDRIIALAGNPNVGKSTVFNALTHMNQHTGNWPGKTVASAQGWYQSKKHGYVMVDIPGTYSLMAHSTEEEVARDFICFGGPDAVVVVCDATCLERNLNLVLQTTEITENVVVCVNLLDEARRKGISINMRALSKALGIPVTGVVARKKQTLCALTNTLDALADAVPAHAPPCVAYPPVVEEAVALVLPAVYEAVGDRLNARWLCLRLLEGDETLNAAISRFLGFDPRDVPALQSALEQGRAHLLKNGVDSEHFKDLIVTALVSAAETIARGVVRARDTYGGADRRLDRLLTGRAAGYPVMLLLLALIFYLTIIGANYPSALLTSGLFYIQDRLSDLFHALGAPEWLHGALVLGVYRVLAWVVSVMLPPMAIFFPLFTLLEDAGYLPRVAYNLDKPFKRCNACGKQALTMCMGFGCNAAGVIGCRIIDSPREQLLAIITNSFVPCNGRFPTLIALLTMFFVGSSAFSSLICAGLLSLIIALSVAMTLLATRLLSKTFLKGLPSSFTLEMPPYRRPQILRVLVRSVFDRTLFVLGRAISVAAPAGLVIWLMANVSPGGVSLLARCAAFLDPCARLLGLDGVILIAFILGFPANEIVVPIIIMAYMAKGSLLSIENLSEMKQLFLDNGWTWVTAVSTMLFSLMHWPCSTTMITIRKETGSAKWTAISFFLPTLFGLLACFLFASAARLFF